MNNICPLCQGKTKLYFDYDKIGKGDYKLLKCLSCGLVFTDPVPDDNFLNDFYQDYDSTGQKDNYYRNLKNYSQTKEGREQEKFFLNFVSRYNFNQDGEILDLGSGGGAFLDIIKRNGFKGLGVEISSQAVEFAKNNFGVECVAADAQNISFNEKRFGAVFMWDLIEHLPEQNILIKKVSAWLAHDGYLVIETPNNDALINKFILFLTKFNINWPASWMFGYHHLFLHSEKSLVKLLQDSGFKIMAINYKNTPADRVFPWGLKFFLPRIFLEILNGLSVIINKKNKLIIIAQNVRSV